MRLAASLLGLSLVLPLAPRDADAQPAPPLLTAPVNDFAGVIDAESARELDALSRRLQDATGDVLVVATVKTFRPWPDLAAYAVRMFENGGKGIGARGRDNGVLIVLALDDREVRIEVGYGLEAFVTDGFAGETARDTMVPFFRRSEYGRGLLAGATRVAARIAQGRGVDLNLAPVRPPRHEDEQDNSIPLAVWILLALIVLSVRRRRRRASVWTSGVGSFGSRTGWGGGGWSSRGGFGGGFGGFGGGRSGGGGGGARW